MSIQKTVCYVVACDNCRAVFDESHADYIVHFDTEDDAIAYISESGWFLTEDGRIECARCATDAICAQRGHDWSDWMPCPCRGTYSGHTTAGCGLLRFCWRDHCGRVESTTLANLPTIDEPIVPGC